MNILDILIVVVLAGGLVRGFSTGVIRQIASFIGVAVAFLLAMELMTPAGELIVQSLGLSETIAPLLGFVLVFAGVQLLVFAIAHLVEALVGALKLTPVNRVVGGLLGAGKAAVLLSVVFFLLNYIEVPGDKTKSDSVMYDHVATVLPSTWNYVSEWIPHVEKLADEFGERIKKELPESVR